MARDTDKTSVKKVHILDVSLTARMASMGLGVFKGCCQRKWKGVMVQTTVLAKYWVLNKYRTRFPNGPLLITTIEHVLFLFLMNNAVGRHCASVDSRQVVLA